MKPIHQYRKLNVQTSVVNATPHQLVQMLFNGARDRLNHAIGYVEHCEHAMRNEAINSVVDILSGLQASLDHEQGGEIAANLEALYDYMQRQLYRANVDNDASILREVADLLATLHSAWNEIEDTQ